MKEKREKGKGGGYLGDVRCVGPEIADKGSQEAHLWTIRVKIWWRLSVGWREVREREKRTSIWKEKEWGEKEGRAPSFGK
jgi:hypothetical protein